MNNDNNYFKIESCEMLAYIQSMKRISKTIKNVFGNENFASKHFSKELEIINDILWKLEVISTSLKENLEYSSYNNTFENDEYLKRVWMTTY